MQFLAVRVAQVLEKHIVRGLNFANNNHKPNADVTRRASVAAERLTIETQLFRCLGVAIYLVPFSRRRNLVRVLVSPQRSATHPSFHIYFQLSWLPGPTVGPRSPCPPAGLVSLAIAGEGGVYRRVLLLGEWHTTRDRNRCVRRARPVTLSLF